MYEKKMETGDTRRTIIIDALIVITVILTGNLIYYMWAIK